MKTLILPNTNNKARVRTDENIKTLISYDTEVAIFNTKTKQMEVLGYHSLTTGRHINKFFKMFGLPLQTKKELFKTYNLKQ